MHPIVKKATRQSNVVTRKATNGAPITFENLAAESNSEFANPRSLGGNQRAVALEAAGNAEALVSPMRNRNRYNSNFPCKKARRIVKKPPYCHSNPRDPCDPKTVQQTSDRQLHQCIGIGVNGKHDAEFSCSKVKRILYRRGRYRDGHSVKIIKNNNAAK